MGEGGMMAVASADIWHFTEALVPVPSLAPALETFFFFFFAKLS